MKSLLLTLENEDYGMLCNLASVQERNISQQIRFMLKDFINRKE